MSHTAAEKSLSAGKRRRGINLSSDVTNSHRQKQTGKVVDIYLAGGPVRESSDNVV